MEQSNKMKEFKIIMLGEPSVGKSSLIYRFIMSKFREHSEATLGTAFFCKVMFVDDQTLKVNVDYS